jgi:prevent-host-death family protein
MLLQHAVKPISYFKAHAADILNDLAANQGSLVITQNGEAKAVLQDICEYERTQESLALLKILALGRTDYEAERFKPVSAAFASVRDAIKQRRQI